MRLKIAGGCGEHGRNCFYVETEQFSFLVDCGVMAGETGGGNPHLTQEEIKRCRYVFLTHSHADHTAAVPWLLKNGFGGAVIATKYTLEQLPFQVEQTLALEEIGKYPMGIYGEKMLLFTTFFIPYALVQYYPLLYVLGHRTDKFLLFLPLLACWFLMPALLLWKFGVRHYKSSGS